MPEYSVPPWPRLPRPSHGTLAIAADRIGISYRKVGAIWNGHRRATLAEAKAIMGDRAPADAEDPRAYLGELGLTLGDLTGETLEEGTVVARQDGVVLVVRAA